MVKAANANVNISSLKRVSLAAHYIPAWADKNQNETTVKTCLDYFVNFNHI